MKANGLAITLLLAVSAQAEDLKLTPQVGDLSGIYSCQGIESGGKKYNGVVTVEKQAEVYVCIWQNGGALTVGVGIRSNDTLSVGWAQQRAEGTVRGVTVFRIEQDKSKNPRMVGRWVALPSKGVIANETLTYLKELAQEDD